MTTIGEVYLTMYADEFDPDDVSSYVGLLPTRVRRRGQRRPEVPLPRHSSWEISTGKIESEVIDIYDMSNQLLAKVTPFTEKLIKAKQKFDLQCVFQVVLWIDQNEGASMPAIGFESSVIDFIHALGASIDIDTYRN